MMTIDETIEAIEELPTRAIIGVEQTCTCCHAYVCQTDDLKALAAELKEYCEFVGAIDRVVIDGKAVWSDDGKWRFFDENGEVAATGTDPFDAWRKMRAERGHDPD